MGMQRTLRSIAILVGSVALLSLGIAGAERSTEAPLIERERLFGDADRSQVTLSPDGRSLAFLAPTDGVMNVWVAPVDDVDAARSVTHDEGRGIQGYSWTYSNDHLVYVQDEAGDENWRVYSLHVESGEVIDLTPLEGVQARLVQGSPDHPSEVLIALNDRVPQFHDLYRVDVVTGERELVHQNDEGIALYLADDDFTLRFAARPTEEGGMEILARVGDTWESYVVAGMEDAMSTGPAALDASGTQLYMLDSRGRDTAALVTVDLETGDETVVFEHPRADVSNVMIHPRTRALEAAAATYERVEWTVLDDRIESDLAILRELEDADVNVVSRSLDDGTWVVAFTRDVGPVRYYLYHRDAGEADFLFTNRSALEGLTLAPMHPVVIEARDGLEMVSYLSLPVGSHAEDQIVPHEPLPLVLNVHGGPWARDGWGFDAEHQWLANRGYAVLSVNFRGSTGFGKAFLNAGNLEWGAAMQDDLRDAVEWAVDQGIADPERVAIMGASYGGYAALAGLTFDSDVYAAGVSIVGPSNLVTLLEAIPPFWETEVENFARRVGDHRTDEGRELLESRSPLNHVESIEAPLLVGQGANDPRVPQAESDQVVEAMRDRDVPVTYVLYPDEGHGFARAANRLSFNAVTEAFLAEVLGGRSEPIGADFEGSSIEVLEGIEHVPGVQEALE